MSEQTTELRVIAEHWFGRNNETNDEPRYPKTYATVIGAADTIEKLELRIDTFVNWQIEMQIERNRLLRLVHAVDVLLRNGNCNYIDIYRNDGDEEAKEFFAAYDAAKIMMDKDPLDVI